MKADTAYYDNEVNRAGAGELARVPLFAHADLSVVMALLDDSAVRTLSRGEALFVPSAPDHVLYLVLDGRLRVHMTDTAQFIEAGGTFGESSLINRAPLSAHIVADLPTRVLMIEPDTFWSLISADRAIARNMLAMVIDRTHANRQLVAEHAARHESSHRHTNVDPLTGLRSHTALVDLLRRQILRSAMSGKDLAVLMLDIDHFQGFAADFGDAAGEDVLCTAAKIIHDQVRPTDIAARLDGHHHFAVILPDCDAIGARAVARRLSDEISQTVVAMADGSILPPVSVSIGIAERKAFEKAEELLDIAGNALTHARNLAHGTPESGVLGFDSALV